MKLEMCKCANEQICNVFSSSMSPDEVRAFAFSLNEILESASSLSRGIWKKINSGEMSDEEAEALLSDIQHEVYHIDYHIHSCKHLLPEDTVGGPGEVGEDR